MGGDGLIAVLLAAGKGERLWPLTSTRPKPLLPVLCKPLITMHLDNLYEFGVREFLIVTSYMKELVEKAVEGWARNRENVFLKFVEQGQPLGTGHAIAQAVKEVRRMGQVNRILIVYSDVFLDKKSYRDFVYKSMETSNYTMMLASRVPDVSRFGKLVVNKSGLLENIVEKPPEREAGVINAGLYSVDPEPLESSLEKLRPSPRGEYEFTDAIKSMIVEPGVKVVSFHDMIWSDVGTPWDYLVLNRLLLEKSVGNHISKEARIGESNVLEGPVFIDRKVSIEAYNRIRGPTVICEGARIGFSVEVKASLLLEGARVPHLSYVGDSIIGENANLGAGTVTANLRHDDAPVKSVLKGKLVSTGMRKFGTVIGGWAKTGINTSILPGVKIGAGAWIGSGCIVDRDVPDNAVLRCRQEHQVTLRDRG